jgi:hypothetical protein
MARESLQAADAGVPLRRPVGLAYYDLSGMFGGAARDVVLYDREAGLDHPAVKPQASSKQTEEFGAILARSLEKARKAVEGIRAGAFTSVPQDENRCRFCPNAMVCRKEER